MGVVKKPKTVSIHDLPKVPELNQPPPPRGGMQPQATANQGGFSGPGNGVDPTGAPLQFKNAEDAATDAWLRKNTAHAPGGMLDRLLGQADAPRQQSQQQASYTAPQQQRRQPRPMTPGSGVIAPPAIPTDYTPVAAMASLNQRRQLRRKRAIQQFQDEEFARS